MIVLHHTQGLFPWGEFARGNFFMQGVSFFFVLSGFILTHVYSARPTGTGRFLLTRAARLWPLHLTTLALVFLLLRPDSRQFPGEGFFDPRVVLVANVLLVHALVPFQTYVFSWNAPSWSISTEWFFYLMFPLLLPGLERNWFRKLAGFAAIIALFGLAAAVFDIPPTAPPEALGMMFLTYSSPFFRGFEFMLGMSTYVWWRRMERNPPGFGVSALAETGLCLVLLWWGLAGFDATAAAVADVPILAQWHYSSAFSPICALLILVVAAGRGPIGRGLSARPLVWLGEISFALYMVHQILMKALYLRALEGKMEPAGPLLVFPLCLAAAAALHHLVEKPARAKILRRFGRLR